MKPLSVYLQNQSNTKDVFVVIKPGFLQKAPAIIDRFSREGFRFVAMRTKQLTMGEAKRMYYTHKDEDFYYKLCKYMSSGPCIGIRFETTLDNPFPVVDSIKDSIRKQYGEDDMRNCLHSSDNAENMRKEMSVFF